MPGSELMPQHLNPGVARTQKFIEEIAPSQMAWWNFVCVKSKIFVDYGQRWKVDFLLTFIDAPPFKAN